MTFWLPDSIHVNDNDLLAIVIKASASSMAYMHPEELADAYFMSNYTNSFHSNKMERVALMPLISPILYTGTGILQSATETPLSKGWRGQHVC